MSETKVTSACKECGRPWRTYTYTTECTTPDCWECKLFEGDERGHPTGMPDDDVDEIVAYQCPHGVMYDLVCRGCGAKVSGWGHGAAGFGELCGCKSTEMESR